MTINELMDLAAVFYPVSAYGVYAETELEQDDIVRVTEYLNIDGQKSTKDTLFELCDGRVIVYVKDVTGKTVRKKVMTEHRFKEFAEMIMMLQDGLGDF